MNHKIGLMTPKKIHISDKTVGIAVFSAGNSPDYLYGYTNKKLKSITVNLYKMERRMK